MISLLLQTMFGNIDTLPFFFSTSWLFSTSIKKCDTMGNPFSKTESTVETIRENAFRPPNLDSPLSDAYYNSLLKDSIAELFVSYVIPMNILHVFHKYNRRVLVKQDLDFIKAQASSLGDVSASRSLLDRLVIYDDWFFCLLDSLRDSDVMLSHVAVQIENIKEDFDQQLMSQCAADIPQELESDTSRQKPFYNYSHYFKESMKLKVKLEHMIKEYDKEKERRKRCEDELRELCPRADNSSADSHQPSPSERFLLREENNNLQQELSDEKEKVKKLEQEILEKQSQLEYYRSINAMQGKRKVVSSDGDVTQC
nr:hypothetical protein BgiMline_020159 [Biomphalaria glabrata]